MISYNVSPEDYLTYQLYMASKSKEIKTKRRRNWLLIPILYIVFAVLAFFLGKQKNIALVFSILAGCWLLIYPFYIKWMYKDKFKKAIIKNNKEIFGKIISLKIEGDKFIINDTLHKKSNQLSEIAIIQEISSHFFVKLNKGSSIIIPKKDTDKTKDIVAFITELSKSSKIKISKELDWKWR